MKIEWGLCEGDTLQSTPLNGYTVNQWTQSRVQYTAHSTHTVCHWKGKRKENCAIHAYSHQLFVSQWMCVARVQATFGLEPQVTQCLADTLQLARVQTDSRRQKEHFVRSKSPCPSGRRVEQWQRRRDTVEHLKGATYFLLTTVHSAWQQSLHSAAAVK